jgi:hypothetical protein
VGSMCVDERKVGAGSARVAGRSGPVRRGVSLLVLVVTALMLCQSSAGASGLSDVAAASAAQAGGAATSAAARAHELGYSLTPSTTEPYAECGHPAPQEAACLSIVVPRGVVDKRSLLLKGPIGQAPGDVNSSLEGSGEREGFSPSDLLSAYKIPTIGGSGQTVALVDAYDDPNAESDLEIYRSHYGLSKCTKANGCFKKVNQNGKEEAYPAPKAKWAVEISLDLDMVSAICSECHILLVEATTASGTNLDKAEQEAYTLGATEISNSWGGPESSEETTEDPAFDHPGVPITASAGDEGYGVSYPAASQYVISVGGTTLAKAVGSRGWQETTWGGSGGGCSLYEPKPVWQTDPSCGKRTDNDVSAVANPRSPVSIYDSYESSGWELVGGTSAAAPIVASVEAHASAAVRDEGAEAFYRHALFDISEGGDELLCDNYLCDAREGYDAPTGWGAPDGPLEGSAGFRAITTTATGVSAGGVTLNGYVNPEGKATTYRFEYGKTTSYGKSIPMVEPSVGSGVTWVTVAQAATGLEWETTYHYRLVATNGTSTSYGQDHTFVTTAWAVQSDPSGEAAGNSLNGVSCSSSSTACVAVGITSGTDSLAEFRSGKTWAIQSVPNPTGALDSGLSGVACSSTTACIAVGNYENSANVTVPLAEFWNGAVWQVQTTLNPTGSIRAWLSSVSCSSSNACTAVGGYESSSEAIFTLAERWNGTEWQIQSTPNPTGFATNQFLGVSCSSSTSCMAVGSSGGPKLFQATLAESWNGTTWQIQSTPTPIEHNTELRSVSCFAANACTAVGGEEEETGTTLAERWNGTEWQIQSTPNAAPVGYTHLTGVSCSSLAACTAIGSSDNGRAIAERWNGTEWVLQAMFTPLETSGEVKGVSCQSTRICISVGRGGGESGNHSLLESESLPAATAEAASGVTGTEVTFNGTINPEESDTHYYFEYGLTTSYGTNTTEFDAGSGGTSVKVSQKITGLKEGTVYHFRLDVFNGSGSFHSGDVEVHTVGTEWRLGGAALTEPVATNWKGKLKLSDSNSGAVVECEDAAEGPVEPGIEGEVTKWTASKCVGVKVCESSGVTVEVLHLPWSTSLKKSSEGTIRDWLVSQHEPGGYKLKCKVLGISYIDECTKGLPIEATMTNGSSGVIATFLTTPTFTCNGKSGVGSIESVQTIEASKGGKLEVI